MINLVVRIISKITNLFNMHLRKKKINKKKLKGMPE